MAKDWRTTNSRHDPWYRPELANRNYDQFGDAYDDSKYHELARKWKESSEEKEGPYLTYVKQLASLGWINLRLLADFMQIGTQPQRWEDLHPNVKEKETEAKKERERRFKHTEVSVLDFYPDRVEKATPIKSANGLRDKLNESVEDTKINLRLYVVEDLSRDVIEVLGQKLKIEPDFFRAHIVDYAWYNVRDRWRDPPFLDVDRRRTDWTQLRYVTARYFESESDWKAACEEAKWFNIMRRPDDDLSNKAWWDKQGAVVGLTRSRATFWLPKDYSTSGALIGVLLLDPTVNKGFPLWRGRRISHPTPQFGSPPDSWPKEPDRNPAQQDPDPYHNSFYEDFLYWAQQSTVFPPDSVSSPHIPMQVLLHLICSEWLTMSDYIKTRLNQVDLELVKLQFAAGNHGDVTLPKLHMWRRFIPLYREMVQETLRHVFRFPCYGNSLSPTQSGAGAAASSHSSSLSDPAAGCQPASHHHHHPPAPGSISSYQDDFKLVLSQLEEYQMRIDRLTTVVTAVMSIEDSQRGLADNHNIRRLTWLATFFIPFSLIAGAFSMDDDVRGMSGYTVGLYFATSVPLALVVAAIATVMSNTSVKARLSDARSYLLDRSR